MAHFGESIVLMPLDSPAGNAFTSQPFSLLNAMWISLQAVCKGMSAVSGTLHFDVSDDNVPQAQSQINDGRDLNWSLDLVTSGTILNTPADGAPLIPATGSFAGGYRYGRIRWVPSGGAGGTLGVQVAGTGF